MSNLFRSKRELQIEADCLQAQRDIEKWAQDDTIPDNQIDYILRSTDPVLQKCRLLAKGTDYDGQYKESRSCSESITVAYLQGALDEAKSHATYKIAKSLKTMECSKSSRVYPRQKVSCARRT